MPALKDKRDAYLADPVLAELQTRAEAFHQARLDRLKARADYGARLQALRTAGAVPYEALSQVLYTQSLPPEAKAQVAGLQAKGVPDSQIAQMIAQSHLIKQIERATDEEDAAEYAAMGIPLT